MKKFRLHFLCADECKFLGRCVSVTVPLLDGSAGIMAGHADMAAIMKDGLLKIDTGEDVLEYAVTDGLVKVEDGFVLILAFSAEKPEEIDEKRAQQAADRASRLIKRHKSELEYRQAQADLSRALNRIKVKHRG
ncbi:MAG: ATP synthase F1 subunit epsilon [Parasporobacterium sp.]|nr:ATP synthase F1 subunit epsilon [Parasporobacterium sp.]